MNIKERVASLRKRMQENEIDIYIIPTADFHNSEYVGDYFKTREYMTGFTGSAGTAVFTMDKAGLWTDARYFIQARLELADSGIQLYEMGEADVPTIHEFIKAELGKGAVLGFDGRTIGVTQGLKLKEIAKAKNGKIVFDKDLVDEIWTERPSLSSAPTDADLVYIHEEKYAGESVASKLIGVRDYMEKAGATVFLLTTLDDICWLLNIRGNDIPFVPFVFSYFVLTKEEGILYTNKDKFSPQIVKELEALKIYIEPYEDIYEDVKSYKENETVLLDPDGANITLYSNLPSDVKVIEKDNPVIIMKAVKNPIEIENTRRAHIKDGVANTKFMFWLKNHPNISSVTEMDAYDKLLALRLEQEYSLGFSFSGICAYKAHAAIPHYHCTQESCISLEGNGLFITDTGGHYLDGSTDITRTYVIGKATPDEKKHFTTVATSMLKLSDLKFAYGCTGQNLDVVAREAFWRQGIDYNHGTGHGVGHLGSIHEPPLILHWKKRGKEPVVFEEYMVLSNEPAFYLEGKYGIRIENELVVRKGEKTAFGQFMYFETITFAPIDLDGISPELMTDYEIELLNNYHEKVYEVISPFLTEEEKDWLKVATRKIS